MLKIPGFDMVLLYADPNRRHCRHRRAGQAARSLAARQRTYLAKLQSDYESGWQPVLLALSNQGWLGYSGAILVCWFFWRCYGDALAF